MNDEHICVTCNWWYPRIRPDDVVVRRDDGDYELRCAWGVCQMMNDQTTEHPVYLGQFRTKLHTRHDFGCNQWQEKPA